MDEIGFSVLMLLLVAWAIASRLLARFNVTGAMVFLAAGYVLANPTWGVIVVDVDAPSMHLLVELTLALLLFSDAAREKLDRLRRDALLPTRLLAVGLPLSLLLGTLFAAWIFDDYSWALAGFVGATLAPTDAALSAPVINDERLSHRVRGGLNVESGLNDGMATPIVAFSLAVVASELGLGDHGDSAETGALVELALGVLVGVSVGLVGAGLITLGSRRGWMVPGGRRFATLPLALASFAIAASLDGNSFVAAFVAGLAFGATLPSDVTRVEEAVELPQLLGELLALVVWFFFGAALLPVALQHVSVSTALYAFLSLTVVRMVPVAVALLGSGTDKATVLFLGWFGPRGLASVVFALLAVEELGASPVVMQAVSVVTLTVLLSVVLHGLSAAPLGGRFLHNQSAHKGIPNRGHIRNPVEASDGDRT